MHASAREAAGQLLFCGSGYAIPRIRYSKSRHCIENSSLRENINHTDVQATLSGNKVKGLTESASVDRRTRSSTNKAFSFRSENGTIDGQQFLDQIYNATSTRTSPENELLFGGNPGQLTTDVYGDTTTGDTGILDDNIGINNCLNLDGTTAEIWNAPLTVIADCDGSGFMDDMNWIDPVWAELLEQSSAEA